MNGTEAYRSYWSKSSYNSVQIANIEDSLLNKQVKDHNYVKSHYATCLDSPLNLMRD